MSLIDQLKSKVLAGNHKSPPGVRRHVLSRDADPRSSRRDADPGEYKW